MEVSEIEAIIATAAAFKADIEAGRSIPPRKRRSIGLLFFENSTRTRVSFEQAAHYLGHVCVSFGSAGSSMRKGETLKDTILTLKNERLEAIVVRHSSSGACGFASDVFEGPVINAGDGQHEHPTQALGDALTIKERLGKLDGLKVAIVGDVLHSRVARSNAWLLSKMGNEVFFVGPRTLLPSDASKLPGHVCHSLQEGLIGADIVMCLRLQRERMDDGRVASVGAYTSQYQINRQALKLCAPNAIVMHPGPINRGIEIDDATADGPSSAISDQVGNSIFVRMAAIDWVFEESGR